MPGVPVLVVDDNPSNLKLLSVLLSLEAYDVRTAAGADEALAVLAGFRPRVILMDLQLPGVDGFELTRRLKADRATRDIIVIAVTAYAMRGDAERAYAAGCDAYVAKPIDVEELPRLVARLVAGAGSGSFRFRSHDGSP